MIDTQIIEQLKTIFNVLEGTIDLVFSQCGHNKQEELIAMLEQVASTSAHINVAASDKLSDVPSVSIRHNGEDTGIRFTGIPGGHEFTSLVLAILNADQKGKLPDAVIINRMRRLKGPIQIKTVVSLSCENCPEVVQALNLIAVFHTGVSHEMVDGAFFQDEVKALGIQGVPSVMSGTTLISSGKTDLSKLLDSLEAEFGVSEKATRLEPADLGLFDVAVVGGGPAGVSAAIYTARKGLKTVIIAERIGGQVKDTRGIENLISVPYTEGPELAGKLAAHVNAYNIKVLEHRRLIGIENAEPKQLVLGSGENLNARAVIIATGAKWKNLDIPGEREYTGRGVAFCPHCDGPFYKGKDVAVIGGRQFRD